MKKILFLLFGMFYVSIALGQDTKLSQKTDRYAAREKIFNEFIEMVFVQGGTFVMGCSLGQSGNCYDSEPPAHQVTVSDFYIGKYEVTQAQWKEIMGDNPSAFKGDSLPVENVSWNDVQEFIIQLNVFTGRNYRLLTEAEWEYAACGGNKSQGYKYSGSNDAVEIAWYFGNADNKTHSVGTKKPNELGIYDMSGNVWEWCYDWYGSYPSNAQGNPTGSSDGSFRIGRGGSWDNGIGSMRVSHRDSDNPDYRSNSLGFRLAHDIR